MRLPSLLLAVMAACSDASGPTPTDRFYEGNLAKWNNTGPASYQMVLTRSCACQTPLEAVRIVVRSKAVESRTFVDTGQPVPSSRAADFPDVDGLFVLINRARNGGADAYTVEYESLYGYPVSLNLNWVAATLTDDVNYLVSEFTPLP